jgi:hypothetical protein
MHMPKVSNGYYNEDNVRWDHSITDRSMRGASGLVDDLITGITIAAVTGAFSVVAATLSDKPLASVVVGSAISIVLVAMYAPGLFRIIPFVGRRP